MEFRGNLNYLGAWVPSQHGGLYQPFTARKARNARSYVQARLALILLLPYCLYSRENSPISILISSMNFIKPSHFKLGCLVVSEGLVHTLGLL